MAESSYSWSPYVYVENNPLRWIDPLGLKKGDPDDPFQLPEVSVTPKESFLNTSISSLNTFSYNILPMLSFADEADAAWARGNYGQYFANLGLGIVDGGMYVASFGTSGFIKGGAKNLIKGATKKTVKVVNKAKFLTKSDPKMLKIAQETFKGNEALRKEASSLLNQAIQGNMNPGLGTRRIEGLKGVYELRGREGARVYFKYGDDAAIEVLGYSNKANQIPVIKHLSKTYGL